MSLFISPASLQSQQKAKKATDLEEEDGEIGEEDSQFLKLAKKVTAKTLQKKGPFASRASLRRYTVTHKRPITKSQAVALRKCLRVQYV